MADTSQMHSQAGATHLRLGDIIVTLILLGLLLFAAWKQFPSYNSRAANSAAAGRSLHQP